MKLLALILGILTPITGYLGYTEIKDEPTNLGAFSDPFLSIQLADNPQNGYILSTDGTDNSWIANSGGGGGGGGLATTSIDTEAELESILTDVTNVFTNNDGALSDDDLSDNSTSDLSEGTNLYYTNARVSSYISGSSTITRLGQSIDISDETNLAGDTEIVLTNDTLSIAASIARDSELHDAVTITGEDYLSLATQQITANAINADNLSATDFGDFTCNGTTCSLDANTVQDNEIDYTAVTLADFTNDAGFATSLDTAYNGGSSITADSGAVAITVPDTSDNAGITVTQNDSTNIPPAFHAISDATGSAIAGMLIENRGDGATDTAFFDLFNNSASPAPGDEIGRARFLGKDSAGNTVFPYAEFEAAIQDETNGTEDGILTLNVISNGSNKTGLRIDGEHNGIIFGDGTNTAIVESNGNTDAIFRTGNPTTGNITITDGANGNISLNPDGTGKVGISTTSPEARLDVWGASGGKILTLFSDTGTKFMEMLNTGVTTLLGAWDFSGASLEIPNGANPTVNATGEVAVETASSTFRYYGSSREHVVYPYDVISITNFASTSVMANGTPSFSTGTSTIKIRNYSVPVTVGNYYCETGSGEVSFHISDGTNDTDVIRVTTSGVEDDGTIANASFNPRDDMFIEVGSASATGDDLTCTIEIYITP